MNYPALITSITDAHQHAQAGAAGAVNRHLILRNWLIGAWLVEFEQRGEDRAKYGVRLLKNVASDLKQRGVNGCSGQMLERMRLFFRAYPQIASAISSSPMRIFQKTLTLRDLSNSSPPMRKSAGDDAPEIRQSLITEIEATMVGREKRQPVIGELAAELVEGHPDGAIYQPPVGESAEQPKSSSPVTKSPPPIPAAMLLRLSWTHLIELIRLDDPWKRAFYENECLKANWSVRQLQRQIGSLLYERTGLSTDKQAVIELARAQARETPVQIADLIRDPYVLEFAGLAEKAHYLERDLETALLDHLQSFLLELGTGFCFEARQKRVTVGGEHDYIDLVFYHRILRCHLLIELKVRAFQHADAGQMNFYLNYWKAEMMQPGDEPPIGLLLCTGKDSTKVEYATGGMDHQLFVSRYLVALPKPEELERLVENDRAAWQQRQEDSER
jgi:predicted nuclease of restriction endonuclease-like (RecB) superfamily